MIIFTKVKKPDSRLKQCVDCPDGVLRPLWKSNPKLCKTHAFIRTAKKQITDKKMQGENSIHEKDKKFYEFIWLKRPHYCANCGKDLFDKMKFDFFHHLLPKRNGIGGYPYFRHEEKNIVLLCWSCHQKAENAISYPKMLIYNFCEERKKQLLATVGIEYESKS